MKLPQIRLESTYPKIEINTTKDQMNIEQPPAEISIQQPPAEMQVERTRSKLTIDQSKARADVDLKSTPERIAEAAQKGRQDLLDGIARRVHEGEELMDIENAGKPISEQAKHHTFIPNHEFDLGWIPSIGSVKIDYDPGKLDINWKVNKPIINNKSNKPIIDYTPGKVETKLKNYQSVKIDFDNLKFIGTNYEQLI